MAKSRSPTPVPEVPSPWAAMLDAVSDLLVLLDAEARLVWVNARVLQCSGRAAADLIGRPLTEALGAHDDWAPVHLALTQRQPAGPLEPPRRAPPGCPPPRP